MRQAVTIAALTVGVSTVVYAEDIVPFHAEIRSQTCEDASCWQKPILGTDGEERYHLSLVPLWAVEGGIVALELVLSRPDGKGGNLLDRNRSEQPHIITVEELVRGIKRSRFGSTRSFRLPSPDRGRIVLEVLGWERGSGAAMCDHCPNIRAIDAVVTVTAK